MSLPRFISRSATVSDGTGIYKPAKPRKGRASIALRSSLIIQDNVNG